MSARVTCELCGETMPPDEILEHLRLFHPAHYDDEIAEEIAEAYDEPEGIETACITIRRLLTADDVLDFVRAVDGQGDDLPLTEALGMLRLAEDTLIRERMGDS